MQLTKRLIAGIGAAVLFAGVILAGSASAIPATATVPQLPELVTFTATIITSGLGSSFTVNTLLPTDCRLTDKSGKVFGCRVSGAGSEGTQTEPATGSFAITGGGFGPVALDFIVTPNGAICGMGTAIEPTGPAPVFGKLTQISEEPTTTNTFTTKAKISVTTHPARSC